jgi:hypothetical protein
MSRKKIVLILGAGASCNYGYPTGSGLRQQILLLKRNGLEQNATNMSISPDELINFVDEFHHSQWYSIDAFLARRMEFERVGKAAIAHVLLSNENSDALFSDSGIDHWYQHLLNLLVEEDWDDLDPSWLSIVTFNYDRSLECFMHRAIQSVYGKSPDQVREKLRLLRIIHVYGDLGSLWQEDGGFPYGDQRWSIKTRVDIAAKRLRVIAEGRDDEVHLIECQRMIREAERVCFLGFGFDQTNLRRIGAPEAFLDSNSVAKRLAATAHGLTNNELRQAAARLVGPGPFNNEVAGCFRPVHCKELLRQSLILGAEFDDGIILRTG